VPERGVLPDADTLNAICDARPVGDDIDYTALANRIRGAHRKREARLERERPAKTADADKLALDDALDLLHGEDARALLGDVDRALRAQVADAAEKTPDLYSVGPHRVPLEDKFLDEVLDYYRSAYDTAIDAQRLAQAVVTGLAASASEDGFVDARSPKGALGPVGTQVLRALLEQRDARRARGVHHAHSDKNTGKYQGLSLAVLHKVALSKERDSYLERMPVVQELCHMMAGANTLSDFKMASVQHLFPSAIALYESLFSAGLNPIDAHIGGKFYSANVNTIARMDARGMQLHMSATDDIALDDADAEDAVREMARQELASMFRGVDPHTATGRQFLLLDDGGKLIEALHEHFPQYAHLCVAVEQTTRGVQVLEKMRKEGKEILCPVVNMAGAELKRVVESPLIAASIVWHVDRYLTDLGLVEKLPRPPGHKPTAVVVGFGATGAATAQALRDRGYDVVVTDTDADKLAAAGAAGFRSLPRERAFAEADLFIGSTGRGAITEDEWPLVKAGAVMVNSASGNHELGIGALPISKLDALDPARATTRMGVVTTMFDGRPLTVGRATDDPRLEHRVLHSRGLDGVDRELLFLRAGSVVNMEHDLPPEFRQIIVAMLLACCFQAVSAKDNGLVDFNPDVQAFLRARFEKNLAELGLSWRKPDLDAVKGPWG
jgi:S-adenosylhomocysteine hydrolase